MVAKKKRVWVKCRGVPLHVWEEKCFKMMGDFLGEFPDFDLATAERKRLDVVRLLIATENFAFINQKLRLKMMGALFDV
jgi:hypothetical protein